MEKPKIECPRANRMADEWDLADNRMDWEREMENRMDDEEENEDD